MLVSLTESLVYWPSWPWLGGEEFRPSVQLPTVAERVLVGRFVQASPTLGDVYEALVPEFINGVSESVLLSVDGFSFGTWLDSDLANDTIAGPNT